MDCEKFESTLIEELYDELDELTSAAHKKHAAGCSRCAGLLSGLRATRRLTAQWAAVALPSGLEDRIFAATREAQKVIPFRSRASRAISWAGRWAMRPQTQTAAVFLLLVGSSVFLVGRRASRDAPASVVTVSGTGAPVAAAATTEIGKDDPAAAAIAHGVADERDRAPAMAIASAAPSPPTALSTPSADVLGQGRGTMTDDLPDGLDSKGGATGDFTAGMDAYRAGRYTEAARNFRALYASGDANAGLWAARSVRDGYGCGVAIPSYARVAAGAWGTPPGYDATLEEARCYRMGSAVQARPLFTKLLNVPTHASNATTELALLDNPPQAQAYAAKAAARPPTTRPTRGTAAAPIVAPTVPGDKTTVGF